jgi:hypothetical protein
MIAPLNRSFGIALAAMAASAGTLVCCVLPAVMVAFGAGAALAGLVTAIPQLVWLSEHKVLVFGVAAIALAIAGVNLWHARRLPCPTDPSQARACARLRRMTVALYAIALLSFGTGAFFAFVLPVLSRA